MSKDDYKDLPPELLEQLKYSGGFIKWELVYKSIKDGNATTVDDMIINIYKDSGQILKRTAVHSCLNKLKKEGLISRCNAINPPRYKVNK